MKTTALETFLRTLPEATDWIYHPPVVLTDYAVQFELKPKIYALLKEYDKQKVFMVDSEADTVLEAAVSNLSSNLRDITLSPGDTVKDSIVLCSTCENDDILMVVSAIMTYRDVWVEVAFIITKDTETLYGELKAAIA